MYRNSNWFKGARQHNRIASLILTGLVVFLAGRWLLQKWHPLTSLQDMFIRDPKAHLTAGIENLRAAQENDPPDPDKLDAAIKSLTKYIDLVPDDPEGYLQRAESYRVRDMLTEALGDVNKAFLLEKSPDAYLKRALIRLDMGAPEKGLADLDRVIELQPHNEVALFTRGGYYFWKEMYPKALNDFDTLLKLFPENPHYWFVRGNIYNRLGNIELMVESLHRMLDIAPAYGFKLSKYEFEKWQRSFDRNSASYKQLEDLIARLPL